MSMKPGYYWVKFTPKFEPELAEVTIGQLEGRGEWSLIGSDYIYHEDEIAIIKEIEKL